jgi:hypothetical protein
MTESAACSRLDLSGEPMCEKCEQLEVKMHRYRRFAVEGPDLATVERIKAMIEELNQRKEGMHIKELSPPVYRFNGLDSDGVLMGSAIRLEFPNDGVAIKHAENIKGHFVEIWQGERRIGRTNIKPS